MTRRQDPTLEVRALLDRMRIFCLPGGDEAARHVGGVRVLERGEMRSSPKAKWTPFTSENVIDAGRSSFRWDARIRSGRLTSVQVTDAYEEGHGYLAVKLGGLIPISSFRGPEFDKGELQRYLASIVYCPPVLLNHPSLEWTAAGPRTLRVRDLDDATGASVDIDLAEDGCPVVCRADRPRMVGKRTVVTPWFGNCRDPREWEGMRVPAHLEVSWTLPEGLFTYYRSEVTSLVVLRNDNPPAG